METRRTDQVDTMATEQSLQMAAATQIALDVSSSKAPKKSEQMNGLRKAAILCLSLGEEAAATLLTHLDEEEVHKLSREIAMLPKVGPETTDKIADEFHQLMVAKNYVQTGGVDYAKRLLIKSFGADAAKRLMDKILHALEGPASFEALQKTDPLQISKLFQSEQPQAIAVVLAHMDASTASAVLRHLPEAQRGEVVLRLASLQNVSQDVVKRTAAVLNQKISSVNTGINRTNLGGVRAVADICNRLDRDTMRVILEQVEESNPPLALEIRNLMVTFEDILLVDDLGVREILQRVDKKALTLALKGTMPELQDRFFSNMSSRAVEMMKEEMDFMGQVKMKDVSAAQREIVEVLRELDETGVINLGGEGDSADEYVS